MPRGRRLHPEDTNPPGACNLGPFQGVPEASLQPEGGFLMPTLPLTKVTRATAEKPGQALFEVDLLDLYAAILIVVPVVLLLKSLWA